VEACPNVDAYILEDRHSLAPWVLIDSRKRVHRERLSYKGKRGGGGGRTSFEKEASIRDVTKELFLTATPRRFLHDEKGIAITKRASTNIVPGGGRRKIA